MGQRKTAAEPVDALTPKLRYRTIHGYRRAFRIAGSGPALLLIHGIGDNSTTWEPVHSELAKRFTVIAPDLLGHGKSDKPRADYSVAAYANGMRDLLSVLDIDRVTGRPAAHYHRSIAPLLSRHLGAIGTHFRWQCPVLYRVNVGTMALHEIWTRIQP